jgi:hypothetical protein
VNYSENKVIDKENFLKTLTNDSGDIRNKITGLSSSFNSIYKNTNTLNSISIRRIGKWKCCKKGIKI